MMRIGEFSILARISIYMLRNYNESGLLVPKYVDEKTGYRYYSEEQLTVANRIQALKAMGFGLADIKHILENYTENKKLMNYLIAERDKKKEAIEKLEYQTLLLENTIETLKSDPKGLTYSISVNELPERYVVRYRKHIKSYKDQGVLWRELDDICEQRNIKRANPRYAISIFNEEDIANEFIDVELQCAVMGKYEDQEEIKFSKIEKMKVATVVFEGTYNQIDTISLSIAKWIKNNHYELTGPRFAIYHNPPDIGGGMEHLVTEVGFPVTYRKENLENI